MSATSILNIIAPQFSSDPDKATYISWAQDRTSSDFYGTKYDMAVALRAAHMMTLRDRAGSSGIGGSGQVASKREGDLAVSFHKSGSGVNADSDLYLTIYGVQLMDLMKGREPIAYVSGMEENECGC